MKNIDPNNRPTVKGNVQVRPNLQWCTSKWDLSIIDVYEILLDPFKHQQIKLLQLGIYYGECMRYFREFFTDPNTVLVGLDRTLQFCSDVHLPNVVLAQGNQEDTGVLSNLVGTHGPFDIIIDDASHAVGPTEASFRYLWPQLKEGGLYLIEDVGMPPMQVLSCKLLDDVVTKHEGKGYISNSHRGFGDHASSSPVCILKKTSDLITGLEI